MFERTGKSMLIADLAVAWANRRIRVTSPAGLPKTSLFCR
jgi:hypothetical protein